LADSTIPFPAIFVIVFVMAKQIEGSYLSICVMNGEKDFRSKQTNQQQQKTKPYAFRKSGFSAIFEIVCNIM
jgi:hypothetical protein